MADSPRSRTTSHASPPLLVPSRLLVPPTLRPSPSLSNLHIHSHDTAGSSSINDIPSSLPSDNTLDSSASSVINLDMTEGIMIQEADNDAETTDNEDVGATGQLDLSKDDNGSKKLLRDQLKKSLSHKALQSEVFAPPRHTDISNEIHELAFDTALRYSPREYFILTDAGKPVFVSRPGNSDQDNTASTIGVMQALISVFIDDGDKLRCINAGRTRITFLIRSPLYYVKTRAHLEYLHLQILSIVTASQLKKIFERRTNFDLRRLLNGAESFMNSMLTRLEGDLAMTTSSLSCLKLDAALRKRIAETLMPTHKIKDVLYIILIAKDRVVTLIRPKKHSIHPADLHIILNTIHSPSIYNNPASSSWIPFCLPKFNPAGFINAFVSFLRDDEHPNHGSPSSNLHSDERATSHPSSNESDGRASPSVGLNEFGVALICISGGAEFEILRSWSDTVIKKLTKDGSLKSLLHAFQSGQTDYAVSELGIPGLRHFVYKSRAQVQTTFPIFEEPYDNMSERRRLITLYQILHDAIHARSGQEGTLKLQYIRTETECVMGWITQPFELYVALSPLLPKTAVVGAANAVTRWVKKEESRLFLRDAPVF